MAHIAADRVKETTTTTGTGTVTLAGAATGFVTFSSVMATSDTCYYCIDDGAGNWEVGVGTLASSTTLARTTLLSSSTGSAVSFAAGTKSVYITVPAEGVNQFGPDGALTLTATSDPAAPASGSLKFYSKNIGGRTLPKVVGPSGQDTVLQPALFGNRIVTFNPSNGTVGTGSGAGLGPAWTSNGTVSHPTPSSTAPAKSNQMKRTRYANIVTTTNQQLGPRFAAASEQQFWRGNAAGLGGFFFYTRFIVELYPASTVRLFAGLTATSTGSVAISDTVLANTCGLWHDTTDPSTGAGAFNFVTKDATTATKQAITLSNAIAAGNSYDFTMSCDPNGSSIDWRLVDNVNGVTYSGNKSTNLPVATAFMQPQVQMSNGTANVTVTTTAIGVANIYVESDF
jgi:hypothetical protein